MQNYEFSHYLKSNMKEVYFKINLTDINDSRRQLTNEETECYLTYIYNSDLSNVLNHYAIFFNSYNISFLTLSFKFYLLN